MIWFTKHAFARVRERLSIIQEEISRFIEDGQTVNVGTEPGTTRDHLLFYSQPDNYYFVVVYDRVNSVVVTILPIDFHNAWRISDDAQKEARFKIMGEEKPKVQEVSVATESAVVEQPTMPCKFRIKAMMWDKKHKWVNCGTIDADLHHEDIDELMGWDGLPDYIAAKLDEKGHTDCKEAFVVVNYGRKTKETQRTQQWRREDARRHRHQDS